MADDTLRIVAKVDDQFTGPLGKLKKELGAVGDEAKKQGSNWKKDWTGVCEDMGKFQGVLKGFEPILSKIGMGGFGAALSLGGAALALKNFSGSTRDLNLMARQIGLTANELRTLSELGGKVGVSADTMKGAINQFAGNMVDLRQRWGQAYGELRNMNLGKLAEELVNAPNMEAAIERAMEGLKGISDPQKRARVSTLLFGTPDIGVVASSLNGPIREAVKRLQAELGTLDKATLEAAERFEANLNRMHNRWEKLKLKTLGPLLEGADKALDQVEKERAAAPSRLRQDEVRRQIDVLDESIARKQANGDEAGAAETKKKRDALAAEMQRLTDEIRKLREGGGASLSPTSFGGAGGGGGSLIHKAAWGGGGGVDGMSGMRDRYPAPSYESPSGSGGATGTGRSGSPRDVPIAPGIGGGSRGYPFNSKVPRSSGASGPVGPGANPSDYKAVLDFIAQSEGTANREGGGYNTSLSYGRLLPGGAEQNLTGKTLDEIDGLQTHMLRNPANRWNSSAIGRYQIVRKTLRGLRRQLGLKGSERYDEAMQDRLAAELARARGPNAHALGKEWASLTGSKGQHAAELMGRIPRSASTTPSRRPVSSAVPEGPVASGGADGVGDALMDRFYGKGATGGGPSMQMPGSGVGGAGRGTLHIKVDGPAGTQVKHELGDLFDDTTVSKGRSQMGMDRA